MKLSRIVLTLIFMISLNGMAACGVGTSNAQGNTDASVLFVQSTNSGSWEALEGGLFLLTLSTPAPNVTIFTDRPDRLASTLSKEDLVQQWASFGFNQSPPNAAIVVHDAPVNQNALVVELSDPQIVGTSLQYMARVLPAPEGTFAQFGTDDGLPTNFDRASLFIDNASAQIFQPLVIEVNNGAPGQEIGVEVSSNGVPIAFNTGPSFSDSAGLQIASLTGQLPIQAFSVSSSVLRVNTSASGGDPLSFSISLFLTAEPGIDVFSLRSISGPGVEVTARVGNSEPQIVNESETLFSWNPI